MRPALLLLALAAGGCVVKDPRYCASSADCAGGLACALPRHECVPADGGVDLAPPGGDQAAACGSSAECPAMTPICVGGRCEPCVGDGTAPTCAAEHPTRPHCRAGACVECLGAAECASLPKRGACDVAAGACVRCVAHADCASRLCRDDGGCEDPSSVLYVDKDKCPVAGADGTLAKPFCEIQDAVGKGKIIRVFGAGKAYGPVTIAAVNATIVGPGGRAQPAAQIAGGASPGVTITGNNVTVVVDGFEILASTQDGIACSNGTLGPDVAVVRSYVHGVTGAGVSGLRCRMRIDRDEIVQNTGGGIALAQSSYDITNTIVAKNGPGGPGVALGSGSNGKFQHNTVADNSAQLSAGGIDCGANGKILENSIIWNNSKNLGSQLFGMCQPTSCVADETLGGAGNSTLPPDLSATYRLSRSAKNQACCIDKVPMFAAVTHDVDGTPRPVGSGWDIGAHEVN